MAGDKGQFKTSAVIAVAALGWFAFPVSSFAQGGGSTSAKQGNPNGPQATNNATATTPAPKPKPKPKPKAKPTTPSKTKPTPKPKPTVPRITINTRTGLLPRINLASSRMGVRSNRRPVRIPVQSQRFSLRLKQPLARTTIARTGWLNLPLSRIQSFGGSASGTTKPKPKPKPKPGTTPAPKPKPKPGTTPAPKPKPKPGTTPAPKPSTGGNPVVGRPASQPR